MDAKAERKTLVKELRAYALLLGLKQVRDDSGRSKVKGMFDDVVAKAGAELKLKAEKTFAPYEATWGDKEATAEPQATPADSWRLRGTSFLFTYNWDFFGKAVPDGMANFGDAGDLWKTWQARGSKNE